MVLRASVGRPTYLFLFAPTIRLFSRIFCGIQWDYASNARQKNEKRFFLCSFFGVYIVLTIVPSDATSRTFFRLFCVRFVLITAFGTPMFVFFPAYHIHHGSHFHFLAYLGLRPREVEKGSIIEGLTKYQSLTQTC